MILWKLPWFAINLIFVFPFVVAQDEKTSNQTAAISGLVWNGLSIQTSDGHCLVHSFDGFIADGHVCGILGPSGKLKR